MPGSAQISIYAIPYESDRLDEALDCFARVDSLEAGILTRFAARGWRGLLEDLRGNRAAALAHYKEALKLDPGSSMQHSQYRMVIDREWVELRLRTAFSWGNPER